MNTGLRIKYFVAAAILTCCVMVPTFALADVDEAVRETSIVEAQEVAIQHKAEEILEKITEVKSDNETFDYVLGMVNRAKNIAMAPHVKFSQFAKEVRWSELEIAKVKKDLKRISERVNRIEGRLQFVDRDIAIRELLLSMQTKKGAAVLESLKSRKGERRNYEEQLLQLKNEEKLQQLKQDLILEYREVLERNRFRRFMSAFAESETLRDVLIYTSRRAALSVFIVIGLFFLFRFLTLGMQRLLRGRHNASWLHQTLSGEIFSVLRILCFIGIVFFSICLFLIVWDIGLSWLILLWRYLQSAHFYFGAHKVTLLAFTQAFVILWLFWAASKFTNLLLAQLVYPKFQVEESLQYTYATAIRYTYIVIGLLSGMFVLGIPLASLTLFSGALGIGLGFGLQELLKNFFAGLNLLLERSVKVGDFIQVGDLPGKVREINAQNTIVDTFDNISVVVPNLEFIDQRIINWSHSDKIIRANLGVGVAYGSDTQLVKNTLLEVARDHAKVLGKPEPSVIFEAFGDSSLNFKLFVWINEPENKMSILSDLHFAVDQKFREKNIQIPFPQRDVHLKSFVNLPPMNS